MKKETYDYIKVDKASGKRSIITVKAKGRMEALYKISKKLLILAVLLFSSCGTMVPNYKIEGQVKEIREEYIVLTSNDTLACTSERLKRSLNFDYTYDFFMKCNKVVDYSLIKR